MAKRVVSAVMVLALLVTVQGQESISSSSSGTGSSSVDFRPSRTVVYAGDPSPSESIHFRAGSNPSSHETSIAGEVIASLSSRDFKSAASSSSDSGRVFPLTTAPAVVYDFSSPPLQPSSAISSRLSDSASVNDFQDEAIYPAGTVEPTEERTDIESTALKFSTSLDQVDATEASPPTSSTTSSDKRATSTYPTGSKNQGDTSELATTKSSLSSPLFCACIVLGVAGLVGAVFSFRARSESDVSDEWRAASEGVVTPPVSHRAAWAPKVSEVHVVIDDHNIAIL